MDLEFFVDVFQVKRDGVSGDENIVQSLRRICAPECLLEIVIEITQNAINQKIERLGLPRLSSEYLEEVVISKFRAAGFKILKNGTLNFSEWSKLETSWARKLQGGANRKVVYLILQAFTPP